MQLLFLLCELKVSPFFYFERSGVLLFQAYPAVKRASRWRLYIPRATPERSEKNHESMVSLEILKPHHSSIPTTILWKNTAVVVYPMDIMFR